MSKNEKRKFNFSGRQLRYPERGQYGTRSVSNFWANLDFSRCSATVPGA